jgi:predicted Zn-dependent peptidase
LDEAELEREKGVVLAELGEARDTPDDIIFDHLSRAAFANQPLGLPVLGDEESIAAIDRGALVAWIEQQYRPSRLVIAAAGKCDEDALLKQVEARFGDLAAVVPEKPARALFTGGTHHDRRRFDQLHLAQAWDAPGFHAKTVHAAGLFSSIAGGGMSSRLFQEVREERGLAYSVYSWTQPLADTGIFGVYCASTRDQAGDAHRLIGEVLARTAAELTEAELARARAQAKAGLLMGLEAVTARADHLARQIQIFGRIVPPEETVALIDAVTIDEARTVGQAMLAGPSALATVGGKLKAAA